MNNNLPINQLTYQQLSRNSQILRFDLIQRDEENDKHDFLWDDFIRKVLKAYIMGIFDPAKSPECIFRFSQSDFQGRLNFLKKLNKKIFDYKDFLTAYLGQNFFQTVEKISIKAKEELDEVGARMFDYIFYNTLNGNEITLNDEFVKSYIEYDQLSPEDKKDLYEIQLSQKFMNNKNKPLRAENLIDEFIDKSITKTIQLGQTLTSEQIANYIDKSQANNLIQNQSNITSVKPVLKNQQRLQSSPNQPIQNNNNFSNQTITQTNNFQPQTKASNHSARLQNLQSQAIPQSNQKQVQQQSQNNITNFKRAQNPTQHFSQKPNQQNSRPQPNPQQQPTRPGVAKRFSFNQPKPTQHNQLPNTNRGPTYQRGNVGLDGLLKK